ncbi:MAG: hypothetical protein HY815_15995 [Candidatus Riflebacteria bacterium]|nr:hypothetical protein [Candidatus Riflebacteria bacterium]
MSDLEDPLERLLAGAGTGASIAPPRPVPAKARPCSNHGPRQAPSPGARSSRREGATGGPSAPGGAGRSGRPEPPSRPGGTEAGQLALAVLGAGPDAGAEEGRAPAVASPSPPAPTDQSAVLMNFKDTSIESILTFLSGLLNVTFVKDEAVQGVVTVINPRKMTAREAIETLEGALALKGYALVQLTPKVYRRGGRYSRSRPPGW